MLKFQNWVHVVEQCQTISVRVLFDAYGDAVVPLFLPHDVVIPTGNVFLSASMAVCFAVQCTDVCDVCCVIFVPDFYHALPRYRAVFHLRVRKYCL